MWFIRRWYAIPLLRSFRRMASHHRHYRTRSPRMMMRGPENGLFQTLGMTAVAELPGSNPGGRHHPSVPMTLSAVNNIEYAPAWEC